MARSSSKITRSEQSLARSEQWRVIKKLAEDALHQEQEYRSALAAGGSPREPLVDALLAALVTAEREGQQIATALAPALHQLFPAPRPAVSRSANHGGKLLRDRVLVFLAANGPSHAREIAEHLQTDLPRLLSFLTDLLRDADELEHPQPGLWGLSPTGWKAVRALSPGA